MAQVMWQLEEEGLGWLPGVGNAVLLTTFVMSLLLSIFLDQVLISETLTPTPPCRDY